MPDTKLLFYSLHGSYILYNCTRKVVLTAAFWLVNLLTDGALATDDAAAAAATRIL